MLTVVISIDQLAKKYHPDVNKDASAQKKFQEVSEAYEVRSFATYKTFSNVKWILKIRQCGKDHVLILIRLGLML